MHETLEGTDFEVYTAVDGHDALEQYKRYAPDIILLDVNMPKLDGFGVCDWIRKDENGKNIPILMITGRDDFASIEKAFEFGATDFLPKPINWPLITHRLKYMLKNNDAMMGLKRAQKKLEHLAFYDLLTDLPNRQLLIQQGKKTLLQAHLNHVKTFVLFINIDKFKRVNDSLGHAYGDKLLKHIALKIQENLRDTDLVSPRSENEIGIARLRGDEFVVLLSNVANKIEAQKVCERIIKNVSAPVQLDSYEIVVTPSIGIAIFPDDCATIEELIECGDIASIDAKNIGKGQYSFYSELNASSSKHKLRLEEAIRNAVRNEEFSLVYQPQVGLHSNEVNSVEVLLRWSSAELGHIPPTEFIPIAEETGIIVELGAWVLKKACEQARVWQDMWPNHPISVAVNISGRQISDNTFCSRVSGILLETGLNPSLLQLEFTESILMNDAHENREILDRLKSLGVSLSIDDFGTGYSSLSYLKKFPLDELKIDRSFIIDIATLEVDKSIVMAILALAKTLKLAVVIEGVEDEHQIACIKSLTNIESVLIQGYYFHRPILGPECTQVLLQDYRA
jgi:diguanylate cyclase (GGDEF)-like protein